MPVEREYRIRFTTVADNSGAVTTQKGLDETKAKITDGVNPALASLGEKTEAAGKAAERSEMSHRGLVFALRGLGPEAMEAGHALLYGFANPALLGLIALGMAFGKVMGDWQKVKEAAASAPDLSGIDKLVAAVGEEGLYKAMTEAGVAAEEFWDKLDRVSTAQATLKERTDETTEAIRKQFGDTDKTLAAREKAELAELEARHKARLVNDENYERQKAAIEDRFADQRGGFREIETDRVIAAKKKELAGQKTIVAATADVVIDNHTAAGIAKGDLESAKAQQAELEQKLKELEDWSSKHPLEIASAEAAQKTLAGPMKGDFFHFFNEMNYQPGMPVSGLIDKQRILWMTQIEQFKSGTVPSAQVASSRADADLAAAQKKVEDAETRVKELEKELRKLESDAKTDRATWGDISGAHGRERSAEEQARLFGSPQGQELLGLRDYVNRGGNVSGQMRAMLELELHLRDAQLNELLSGISSLHGQTQAQNAKIFQVVQQIKQNESPR